MPRACYCSAADVFASKCVGQYTEDSRGSVPMADTNETQKQFVEAAPRFGYGPRLDHQKFARFLAEVCAPYREFYTRWQRHGEEGSDDFFLYNYWFESIDAEVLYCLVRHLKPK